MDPRERLIVALDVPTASAAGNIVAALGDSVGTYKVGLQLYTAAGPQIVRDLISSGRKVFLDLKYHDIPNTVASAVREAASLGVEMLTVHALGGEKMLRAAVEASRAVNPHLKVLAVTVLTSMNESDLGSVGVTGGVLDQVIRLGSLAINNGCHGLVASAQEASQLRRQLGDKLIIVTPGVRPAGADHDDQARVVTPTQAIDAGADYIVVGRPIIAAPDPRRAADLILEQIGTLAPAVR